MALDYDEAESFLSLSADKGFQAETAALRAKATFKELLGTAPDFAWGYTAERIVRNATVKVHETGRRASAKLAENRASNWHWAKRLHRLARRPC